MKIAIYNKSSHIKTYGGGEKVMAQMIKGLMDEHDVTLISEEIVDLEPFIKKFNIDITKVKYDAFPSEMQLREYTKDFDIFINTSHNISNLFGKAKHNILYISFPKKILLKSIVLNTFLNKILSKFFSLFLKKFLDFELSGKFLMLDIKSKSIPFIREFKFKIQGESTLTVNTKGNKKIYLTFDAVLDAEKVKENLSISFKKKALNFEVNSNSIAIDLNNISDEIVNLDIKLKDKELLKHPNLYAVRNSQSKRIQESVLMNFFKLFKRLLSFRDYIESYDLFLSNSEFTKSWTKTYWNKETHTLYPPSEIETINPENENRENKIITIGRFFEDEHNKKHIPMIMAFRKLIDDKKLQNWELHMCGGSMKEEHNQKYLRKVKYLTKGYPITIHEDIPFKDMIQLLSESKLFWHAAGIGEDENLHPIKMEHFGIVTVEAMCSGVVPIIINKAGQKETIENGKSGYVWNTLEELQNHTVELSKDSEKLNSMRKEAIQRAKMFNTESFNSQLRKIISKF